MNEQTNNVLQQHSDVMGNVQGPRSDPELRCLCGVSHVLHLPGWLNLPELETHAYIYTHTQ